MQTKNHPPLPRQTPSESRTSARHGQSHSFAAHSGTEGRAMEPALILHKSCFYAEQELVLAKPEQPPLTFAIKTPLSPHQTTWPQQQELPKLWGEHQTR